MVTKFEYNGEIFSLFVKCIFMVTFLDIYGDWQTSCWRLNKGTFGEMYSMDGVVLVVVKGGELLLLQIDLHDRLMDLT